MSAEYEQEEFLEEQRLQPRLSTSPDRDVLDFFQTYVDSFIKWDVLTFLHKNPSTLDTADNIARYVGRVAEDVEPALRELTAAGLLQATSVKEMRVYTLNTDAQLLAQLAKFATAAADGDFRRQAVYYLVRQ